MQTSARPPTDSAKRVAAWTKQLYAEYERVVWETKVKLSRPFIYIDELRGRWADWDGTTRTIRVSRSLIEQYPWYTVVEVLKHEIAHQWVSEQFSSAPSAHGPEFKQACRILGVSSWAARACGELQDSPPPDWRDNQATQDEQRLLRKVEKLLSLATSSNEHEALLAMQRVQDLYAKYNLDCVAAAHPSTLVFSLINRKKKKIDAIQVSILSILCSHFYVRVVYTSEYDAQAMTSFKVAELLGRRENVLMAEYVYHFLWEQVHRNWKTYQKLNGKSARAKLSYIRGQLEGFRKKLAENKERTSPANVSKQDHRLIETKSDAELEQYVNFRHRRLVSKAGYRRFHDSDSYAAGVKDGRKITLHRPVAGRSDSRKSPQLLGP